MPRPHLVLLAPLGGLVAHALTPLAFHEHGVGAHPLLHSHGAESVVLALSVLLGFVGVVRTLGQRGASMGLGPRTAAMLAVTQVVLFSIVEMAEASWVASAVLAGRTFWLGLAVQLAVALLTVGLLRAGWTVLDRVRRIADVQGVEPLALAVGRPAARAWSSARAVTGWSPRGPPRDRVRAFAA